MKFKKHLIMIIIIIAITSIWEGVHYKYKFAERYEEFMLNVLEFVNLLFMKIQWHLEHQNLL